MSLTDAIDVLTGTAGNDVFLTSATEMSAADQLDGGAGTDTLRIAGGVTEAQLLTIPTLKNVEIVEFTNPGNIHINVSALTTIDKVVNLNVNSANSGKTITVADGVTVGLATAGGIAAGGTTTVAFGATETASTLELLGFQTNATAASITLSGAKSTTLNVVSTGAANKAGTLTATDGTTKVVITGDQKLTADLTNTSTNTIKTVDASDMTAAATLNVVGTHQDLKLTGGSGDDKFVFGGGSASVTNNVFGATDKVDGGAGFNTLAITGAGATAATAIDSSFAGILDGKTGTVANNTNIQAVEVVAVGTGAGSQVTIDAGAIKMASVGTYIVSGNAVGAAGATNAVGVDGVAITNQSNAQAFEFKGTITGGVSNGSGANGGAGISIAPASNTATDVLNITLNGVTVTGGAAANSSNKNGGDGVVALNFETINITSAGATATTSNSFVAGALDGTGAIGSSISVSANTVINISGANGFTLGTLKGAGPVKVDASSFTGKLTMTGTSGVDTIIVGGGDSVISASGGADVYTLGAGKNTIVYTAGSQSGETAATADSITDFTVGVNIISLVGVSNTGGTLLAQVTVQNAVDLAAPANLTAAIAAAEAALGTNKVGAFQFGGNTHVFANDDNAGVGSGDILIVLEGLHTLTADNFILA